MLTAKKAKHISTKWTDGERELKYILDGIEDAAFYGNSYYVITDDINKSLFTVIDYVIQKLKELGYLVTYQPREYKKNYLQFAVLDIRW